MVRKLFILFSHFDCGPSKVKLGTRDTLQASKDRQAEQRHLPLSKRNPQAVSYALFCDDVTGAGWVGFQFLAECVDCSPQLFENGVAVDLTPDFLGQPLMCQEPAGVLYEHLQQRVLIRREFNLAVRGLNDVAARINGKIACNKNRLMLDHFSK
jgi:hypothetical protein